MFHDIDAFKNEAIFINSIDKNQAWQGDNYPLRPTASRAIHLYRNR
ncbi:hypothetical protein [Paraflavitalea speifideaquila]|nr:hypothetical protein [Paraflavitalea speifideiaquila]